MSVGSQVSGQIKELFADYNSQVTKGQIIARINPDNYEAKLNQAEAELALAQAQLETKKADVQRAKAEVENAESSPGGRRGGRGQGQGRLYKRPAYLCT